jgi:hypothetical protein
MVTISDAIIVVSIGHLFHWAILDLRNLFLARGEPEAK